MDRPTYPTFDSYDHVDADYGEIKFLHSIAANQCPICDGQFVDLLRPESKTVLYGLSLCIGCGWWHLHRDQELELVNADAANGPQSPIVARWWEMHHAVLHRLDPADETLPIEALRAHLVRYWDQRTDISAQQAEDLVASVLREHHRGEIIRLTANANAPDGGIDLILVSDGAAIGRALQVKRRLTRDVEGVQDVRNFVGAMVLAGELHGTFVTTASRFSCAARKLPESPALERARLRLELMDGEQLLELLEHVALKCDLVLPLAMSLDQTWFVISARDGGFYEVGARELLLGDLRKLAPLARTPGLKMRLPGSYARPLGDFERDFSPVSPVEAELIRKSLGRRER